MSHHRTGTRRAAGVMFLAIALGAGAGAKAQGLFSTPAAQPAEARLLRGWAEDDGQRVAGFEVDLADGWKTYWRAPGEAGIPPRFDWSGSENIADLEILWPAPIVFDSFGLKTLGYKTRMVLPLRLTPADPARPMRLSLSAFYGVCEDICVPAEASLSIEIAPGAPEEGAGPIRAALNALPGPAAAAGLESATCAFEGAEEERRFTARLSFGRAPEHAPVVVAEGSDAMLFSPLETTLAGDMITASGEVRVEPGAWIDRSALKLTLIDPSGGALELIGCASG
ncbi:MAG: protein-disulfide reductase DsbD domain-containing protein [Pikeienuella sp.]